MPVLQ